MKKLIGWMGSAVLIASLACSGVFAAGPFDEVPDDVIPGIASPLDNQSFCNFADSCKRFHELLAQQTRERIARTEILRLRGEMIEVEEGPFEMGSPATEDGRYPTEEPLHVKETETIRLGKYPVTQEQYLRVMGAKTGVNPSRFKNENDCQGRHRKMKVKFNGNEIEIPYCLGHPVENLNRGQMIAFQKELAIQVQGLMKVIDSNDTRVVEYVFPTEEQWEKATQRKEIAPDGSVTFNHVVYSGTDDVNELAKFAVFLTNKTAPVGSKEPNHQGFYDMSGNVWEMTDSQWVEDPRTPDSDRPSSRFVGRGGSWYRDGPGNVRSSVRNKISSHGAGSDLGFRLGEVFR